MKYDDIVIGAGVSGLTAAILLAQQGRRVAVMDKAPVAAPAIRGFVRNGVYFDTGFHYAAMLETGKPLSKLFERLGILSHLKLNNNLQKERDLFYHVPSGFQYQFAGTLPALNEQLTALFPNESDAIRNYLAIINHFITRIENSLFTTIMDPSMIFENTELSLEEYLQKRFDSPLLKTILSIHSVLYGSRPQETSLNYHTMIAGGYYTQTQQVYNGGSAIAAAFEKELKKHNITLLLRHTVGHINLDENKTVTSVTVQNGQSLACTNCIYTGHPRLLTSLLNEGTLRGIYQSRLMNLEDTLSALVIYCRSKKSFDNSLAGNIILTDTLFPEVFGCSPETGNNLFFVSRSLCDNHEGGISIICPWPYESTRTWESSLTGQRDSDYSRWKQQIASAIVEKVTKHCGESLGDLEIMDIATPLTFRDYLSSPGGGLYGAKHRISDIPLLSRTSIKGLYLSGQSVMATGVMGATLSGFVTASYITGEDYRKTMDS
jgi:all-trans-retinol 13,14-reductase